MDKKKLTKNQLLKDYSKFARKSMRPLFMFIPFGLLCIILIPLRPLAWGLGLLTFLIFGLLYKRMRSQDNTGNPRKAYIRLLTLTSKDETSAGSEEDGWSFYYYLTFDEKYRFEVIRREYKDAEEGKPYYVAFFEKDDKPFLSYSVEDWDPDGSIPVH